MKSLFFSVPQKLDLFHKWSVIWECFFLLFTGSVSVLPTVLYLLLGVLREVVKGSVGAESGQLVPGILQALRTVLTSPMSRAEKSRGAWTELLRCALHTLLESCHTGSSLSFQPHSVSVCFSACCRSHLRNFLWFFMYCFGQIKWSLEWMRLPCWHPFPSSCCTPVLRRSLWSPCRHAASRHLEPVWSLRTLWWVKRVD